MSIATSANVVTPAPRRFGRRSWLALLASLAVVPLGAQQFRPVPKFEGKAMPEPPSQGKPWTAPATKLPKFLATATGILFDQGVADPRGCEYRHVEIGEGSIVKAVGFVLPERADAPGRFVVCWDGLVRPALSVGEPADLDREMKDLADYLKKTRKAAKSNRFGQGGSWGFARDERDYYGPAGVDDHSPIKLCLLLRLGRADLAEALFAAATTWTPEPRARDLTNYGISYLTLAFNWAVSAFQRLIEAHLRGDDVIALDAARKLARFRDLATARADAMGFPRGDRQNYQGGAGPVPRFYFLSQLDELLRDHERRAKAPARGPIPKKGGDPAARVAALIRDLDQIDEQQMMSPGGAYPGGSPLVKDLIAEGDPAVAPLLEVLESDDRLTRSVSNGRGSSIQRFVHPVHEAALAALIGILKTREFDNQRSYGWSKVEPAARKALAASMRQFWEKTRSIPLTERWYRTLLDDSAGPGRWLEAAGGIVSPDVKEGEAPPKPGTAPMRGEPLRSGRDPSVTDLMLRRAGQIEQTGNPNSSYDDGLMGTCHMVTNLAAWDGKAALPLLKDVSKACRARSDRWRNQANPGNADRSLASNLVKFTLIRDRLGDVGALDEYADWLRTISPKMLEYDGIEAFQPLLDRPDHPALAAAARWLFNDPKSPWVPLLPEARGPNVQPFQNLFASPLIVVAGFREGVLAGLADRTPLGSVSRKEDGTDQHKIRNVQTMNYGSSNLEEGIKVGLEYPFRNRDYLAWKLSSLEGCPHVDLFWPENRRDEAVAACVAFLKRYGDRFTPGKLPGMRDSGLDTTPHLRFPILKKPATPEDVASNRAIFSLEGQGETRLASLPGFPQMAQWVTLKDSPSTQTDQNGVSRVVYNTDGYLWQAEEVRKGDGWERWYGFVGRHVIARAPASEIEFTDGYGPWRPLKGGLDARLELVEPRATGAGFEPGRPIPTALHIRNRLGVARSSPTDFIRPAPDGKPALRKGVVVSLWRSSGQGSGLPVSRGYPNDAIEPKRRAEFDPGVGSRSLAPLEAFEAMRLDVDDWFDLTKPGAYRFQVSFAADGDLGEGGATEVYFRVGDAE